VVAEIRSRRLSLHGGRDKKPGGRAERGRHLRCAGGAGENNPGARGRLTTVERLWPAPSSQKDTLIYFLAHDSREAAKASWAAFQADPVWVAARDASEADGKLLQPRGVTSVFLKATDFSAVK